MRTRRSWCSPAFGRDISGHAPSRTSSRRGTGGMLSIAGRLRTYMDRLPVVAIAAVDPRRAHGTVDDHCLIRVADQAPQVRNERFKGAKKCPVCWRPTALLRCSRKVLWIGTTAVAAAWCLQPITDPVLCRLVHTFSKGYENYRTLYGKSGVTMFRRNHVATFSSDAGSMTVRDTLRRFPGFAATTIGRRSPPAGRALAGDGEVLLW